MGTTWEQYTTWDNIVDGCDYKCRCKRACESDIDCPDVLAKCKEACNQKKSLRPRTGFDFYQAQPYAAKAACESKGFGTIELPEVAKPCTYADTYAACKAGPSEEFLNSGNEGNTEEDSNAVYIVLGIIIVSLILYLIFS